MPSLQEIRAALEARIEAIRNAPPSPFGDGPLTSAMVSTTRHDNRTVDDEIPMDRRVRDTSMYLFGLATAVDRKRLSKGILRFHDHKGVLYVLQDGSLTDDLHALIAHAWHYVAGEYEVILVQENDPEWINVWGSRKF